MSDATSSPAQVLADHGQRPEPFRNGVLHVRELPLAGDRTAACLMIRGAGSVARAHRRIPGYRPAPSVTTGVSWPAPLVGVDNLLLIFPPGGKAGRD
jgi:hypothetical protein